MAGIAPKVIALRSSTHKQFNDQVQDPISVSWDRIPNPDRSRCRIVLKTKGCSLPTCSMCCLPEEALSPMAEPTALDYIAQIEKGLAERTPEVLTLFTNGNFFNPKEIPESAQLELFQYLNTKKIPSLVVESLPQFVTQKRLQVFKECMPATHLSVAIGLQCASDTIRKEAIGSTATASGFLRAKQSLDQFGYSLQCFVLYGIPFLTTAEAEVELLSTLDWLKVNAVSEVTVCPLYVGANTLVEKLVLAKEYAPPRPEDLLALIPTLANKMEDTFEIRVALSLVPVKNTELRQAVSQLNSKRLLRN